MPKKPDINELCDLNQPDALKFRLWITVGEEMDLKNEPDHIGTLMKFVKTPLDGDIILAKDETIGLMYTLLKKLKILSGKPDPNELFTVADINKLAELAGVDPLPDFDHINHDTFYEAVTPFMERVYRSDQFWTMVEERGLNRQVIMELVVKYYRYGEIRQQLCYLKQMRTRLEEVITASKTREAELQKELDDFE